MQSGALLCSGLVGAIAGVVLAAYVSSATPAIGDSTCCPRLLPSSSAPLSSRLNDSTRLGTVIAVFMLRHGRVRPSRPRSASVDARRLPGGCAGGGDRAHPPVRPGQVHAATPACGGGDGPGRRPRSPATAVGRGRSAGDRARRRPVVVASRAARRGRERRSANGSTGTAPSQNGAASSLAGRDRGALQDLPRATGAHRRQHGRSTQARSTRSSARTARGSRRSSRSWPASTARSGRSRSRRRQDCRSARPVTPVAWDSSSCTSRSASSRS